MGSSEYVRWRVREMLWQQRKRIGELVGAAADKVASFAKAAAGATEARKGSPSDHVDGADKLAAE